MANGYELYCFKCHTYHHPNCDCVEPHDEHWHEEPLSAARGVVLWTVMSVALFGIIYILNNVF